MYFSNSIPWKLFEYGNTTIKVQFSLKGRGAGEKSSGVQDQKILTGRKHMQWNSRLWRYQNMFGTKIVKQNNYCLSFFFGKNKESYVHVNAKPFLKALKICKSSYMLCFKRPLRCFIWEIFSYLIWNFLGFVIIS